MDERSQVLEKNFMLGTIDFWTDPHHKQQFGCFVFELTAEKNKMQNGLTCRKPPRYVPYKCNYVP